MNNAQTILSMIENVDPSDADTLDEIDARAYLYVYRRNSDYHSQVNHGTVQIVFTSNSGDYEKNYKQFTRSRDALQEIRPEESTYRIIIEKAPYCGGMSNDDSCACTMAKEIDLEEIVNFSAIATTEELAELHAIIQAIEWERNQDEQN